MTNNVTLITLITLITFMGTTGLIFLLARGMVQAAQSPLRRRLDPTVEGGELLAADSEWIDRLAVQLPQRETAKLEIADELRRAGYFKPNAVDVYLSLRNGAVIAVAVATGLLVHFVGPDRQELVMRVLAFGLAIAGMCWGLPRLWIRTAGKARVERVSRGLPFGLDMTVMCLSGGLTLREALIHVSQEIGTAYPDLAKELAIIQQHADMSSMEMAFRQFARRIDSPEVAAMVALIIQNEQLGTNVAHSVRQYADAIRLKWRQLADERASKIGVYLLFPITLCLLPAALILMWGPAAVEMMQYLQDLDVRMPDLPDVPTITDPMLNQ